jgi:parallel beta-helix repeat protein
MHVPAFRLLCHVGLLAPICFLGAAATRNPASADAGGPRPPHLFVSPHGNDGWSGRLFAPNDKRTDGPLATLEGARNALRALRQAGKLGSGATVSIRAGTYELKSSLELGPEDGGASDAPIVYRAFPGEKPQIVGGRVVSHWNEVTDQAVLRRLEPDARDHVLQIDLKALGISDFGQMRRKAYNLPVVPSCMELFTLDAAGASEHPMQLARWPKSGWLKLRTGPQGKEGSRFGYDDDRPKHWAPSDDIWVHGYWEYDWADSFERVRSLDAERREVVVDAPATGTPTAGQRFTFLNVLEEVTAPGDYYVDRKTGILYFYPASAVKVDKHGVVSPGIVSVLEEPMISIRGASYVTLLGLTLECSRGCGVSIEGGTGNLVQGCRICCLGGCAVSIGPGKSGPALRNGVVGCDVTDTGEGGIQLSGGDRRTLTPAGNYADNNDIWNYSRWTRTYRPGVGIDGVGNRISHNRIHDAPHNAILLGGNDHTIEFNEIYRVCTEVGDAGAFYMGRNMTTRGNVIRYNSFRDLKPTGVGTKTYPDVMGVYLDDCACGTKIYGNLFLQAGHGIMIGGGRDNEIRNNIFVGCSPAISVDSRGTGWANFWFNGKDPSIMDGLKAVPYDRPPYSNRYPHLANLLQDSPAEPKYNRITNNLCIGTWLQLQDNLNDRVVEIHGNLLGDDAGLDLSDPLHPGLRPDSHAPAAGFQPIPVSQIGLRPGR